MLEHGAYAGSFRLLGILARHWIGLQVRMKNFKIHVLMAVVSGTNSEVE